MKGFAKKIIICLFVFLMFSCACNCDQNCSYFAAVAKNDIPLSKPKPGDWLYAHVETGQSIEDFKKSNPLKPNQSAHTIYLVPIGNFNDLQLRQIEITRQFIEIFFQLKTIGLSGLNDNVVPAEAMRTGAENQVQLQATHLRDSVVANKKPKDALAIMGITEKDLFPKQSWNFVFGLASYEKAVAVSSVYRLQRGSLTRENFNLSLIRLLKISTHEIGHMFGLKHCIVAACVMNGSNSLSEIDNSILRLCSNCQHKLSWSLDYDNERRLTALITFLKQYSLKKDLVMLNHDYSLLNSH